MFSEAYPEGIDAIWLGSDRNEKVGAFVTAGCGPIPVKLSAPNVLAKADELINKLPRYTTGHMLVEIKRPDDFLELAERGLFVYDWSDIHRLKRDQINAYELVTIPSRPIAANELPDELRKLVARVQLDIEFQAKARIDIQNFTNCILSE